MRIDGCPASEPGDISATTESPKGSGIALFRRFLPRLILLAAIALGVYLVVRNGPELRQSISEVGLGPLGMSLIFGTLGTFFIGQVWFSMLRGLGAEVSNQSANQVFFVSQLGKYIPGSVWPVISQMEYGRRSGTPPRLMLAANLLMTAVVVATGLIVAAVILPFASDGGLDRYWPAFLALIPFVACLHPRFISACLDRVFLLFRRKPLRLRVHFKYIIRSCIWGLGVWVLLGAHIAIMTIQYEGSTVGSILVSLGAMGLAFTVGIIFIPAPAGAGVRDAVLTTFLGPVIGLNNALAVALASRAVLIISDVVLAAVGFWVGRRNRKNMRSA